MMEKVDGAFTDLPVGNDGPDGTSVPLANI
jgi:hypothetical protein